MPRIVIELTNRCNLSCGHCFNERHAATGDLSLEILEKVLREGKGCGIERLCSTSCSTANELHLGHTKTPRKVER